MKRAFKVLVSGTTPVLVVAGAAAGPAAGDEIQNVIAQAVGKISTAPSVPAMPPPAPMPQLIIISGMRP